MTATLMRCVEWSKELSIYAKKYDGPCREFDVVMQAVQRSIFGTLDNMTQQLTPVPFKIDSEIEIVGTENFYHFHKVCLYIHCKMLHIL